MKSVPRPRWLALNIVIMVFAAGCTDAGSGGVTSSPLRATESTTTHSPDPAVPALPVASATPPAGPRQPPEVPAPSAAPPPAALAAAGVIVLEGNGLGFVTFGEPENPAIERLTSLLGPPTKDEQDRANCSLDRTVWWGSLMAGFQEGKMVSYLVSGAGANQYRTNAGIGPGATLAQIQEAYGPDLPEGPESMGGSYVLKTETGDIYAFISDVITLSGSNLATLTAGPRC
jgi:hypothetical protein